MNLNPHTIAEAEREGMPEVERETMECPNCERRIYVDGLMECRHCKKKICGFCAHINQATIEAFCTEQITVNHEPRNIPTDCVENWLHEQWVQVADELFKWKQEHQ